MNSPGEISFCHSYPIIYKVDIEQKCFDEILDLFLEDILQRAPCNKVEAAIVNYITRVIEPIGWKAVWRATSESLGLEVESDFLVEVLDVSLVKLEAEVVVKSILVPEKLNFDITCLQEKFSVSSSCVVPLIELYPISEGDEEEMFARTAVAIEHVRLFYKHLYRPWDSEDDILCYSEKILQPRLQLYFDIVNKVIPGILISKIEAILKEGWTVMGNLRKLYSHMHLSDSEVELVDEDIVETLELRKQIEDLQRKMDILENPVIRTIMMKNLTSRKSPQKVPHPDGPMTILVASNFTYGMITRLNLDASVSLRFEECPEQALKTCTDGDTVLIFPGRYHCDTLGWLEHNITVKGIGPNGAVRIKATGNSEVFVNCDSENVHLENLSLMSAKGTVCTMVVHHGRVLMKDCLIDADNSELGVTLLGGAELEMVNSEVCSATEDGIQMRPASVLKLLSSKVVSCGRNGIQVDSDDTLCLPDPGTELYIIDSYIVSNEGYGIFINSAATKQRRESGEANGEFYHLNLFPWLKHNVVNSIMSHNKYLGIGSVPLCRMVKDTGSTLPDQTE